MPKNNLAKEKLPTQKASTKNSNKLSKSQERDLNRSPGQQAEVERIGKADTYCGLDRDEELFSWLNDHRDLKLCGYVVASGGSGLSKACQAYRMAHVRRRGSLFEIPATVVYIEMLQKGKATDLYRSILGEFGHPLSGVGRLNDLRSRAWGTLKRYGVKLLIIGNTDYLNLEAFNELIELFANLRITVVLTGTHYLEEIFKRNSYPYVRVHDSFLEWHEFPNLTLADVGQVVEDWEAKFLAQEHRLNLIEQPDVISTLLLKSNGLMESLYDMLRQLAVLRIDEPDFELSSSNLQMVLSHRQLSRVRL